MKKGIIILMVVWSCATAKKEVQKCAAPTIKGVAVTEHYFGQEVFDPYRNIENTQDSVVNNWYKSQGIYADSIMNLVSGRDALVNELYEISNRKTFKVKNVKRTDENQIFYLKKNSDETYYRLYFKGNSTDESELIFDPKTYNPSSKKEYVINYISPSWNAEYIVISLTHSGKQLSELIIMDMKTKKPLQKVLQNAWPTNFLGVNWLPDNSGFTYLYFPDTDISNPKFRQNTQSALYLINEDKIIFVFGNRTHSEIVKSEIVFPITKISESGDKYIIGYLAEVDNYWDAFYAKISDLKTGNINWKPLYKKADKVMQDKGYFQNEEFIFLTAFHADNKKIMSDTIATLDINNAKTIVPEKPDEIIDDFELTKDALYYSTLTNGVDAKLYKFRNNQAYQIETPVKAGQISLSNTSIKSDDLWVTLNGWISPNLKYKYDESTNTFSDDQMSPKVNYPEFETIIAKEISFKSYDGTEVPLSIVMDKNTKLDGKNPVFIYGYGAYGDIESPYFSSIMLDFVAKGGIFCVAHVRGGGEKGDAWHKQGYKNNKPNTWKDLIACTEYLIDQNYTSKNRTAIYGASAGAIMAGRAMTERPDLFEVVIIQVGYLNPFRAEVLGAAGTSTKEYGTVTDSLECSTLINIDPYLNIKDNTDYPATLLTVGMNDPLVMPWMSGKFTARLQDASISKNPILLFSEFDEGHEGGSNTMKVYKDWATIFSFVFWQTGHKDYQLQKTNKND